MTGIDKMACVQKVAVQNGLPLPYYLTDSVKLTVKALPFIEIDRVNNRKLGYVHAGRNTAYSDTAKKLTPGFASFDFDLLRLNFYFQKLGPYFRVPGT